MDDRVSGTEGCDMAKTVCASMRRRHEAAAGSVVVFQADRMESRLGAAVGMAALGGSLDAWNEEVGENPAMLRHRSALLIDVGVGPHLLQSLRCNEQEIVLVETSPGRRGLAQSAAGSRTKLVGAKRGSAATLAWMTLCGTDEAVPAVMQGTDWMRVGTQADEAAVRLALGAILANASVKELASHLSSKGEQCADWAERGGEELCRMQDDLRDRADSAQTVSLAGARIRLAHATPGLEGALARACVPATGGIGAAWVESGDWRELTLSAGDDVSLAQLCSAFGGYGEVGFGRISLSVQAFRELQSGRLGVLDAWRMAEPEKAADVRQLACVVRDDMCIGMHVEALT